MSIIIAFSKIENGMKIKDLLIHNGFDVAAVHTTAAAALQEIDQLESGILICGSKLPDMLLSELNEYLPDRFEMLLIAPPQSIERQIGDDIISLTTPLKAYDLLQTVQMMTGRRKEDRNRRPKRPKPRNEKEQKLIQDAKVLLMERNHLTEEEAYRYIQKSSMNSGTNMVEAAQMIIAMIEF